MNDQLAHGRPFFVDIARDGLVIYEAPGFPLIEPKPLAPEVAKAEARRHFDHWFPGADRFLKLATVAIDDGFRNEAAFLLHQTAERLYHCILLVLALYRMYQEQGSGFVPKYLELLAAGGSKAPQAILAEVGVDMNSPAFWQSGFDAISGMVDQLEQTMN